MRLDLIYSNPPVSAPVLPGQSDLPPGRWPATGGLPEESGIQGRGQGREGRKQLTEGKMGDLFIKNFPCSFFWDYDKG